MRFLGTDSDVAIDQPPLEFKAWHWTGIETVVELAVRFKRALYEDVIAELSKSVG